MIVLSAEEIKYCQLSKSQLKSKQIDRAITYHGLLFVKVAGFALNQFQDAIELCREFLGEREPVVSIVVKEKNQISLWSVPPDCLL